MTPNHTTLQPRPPSKIIIKQKCSQGKYLGKKNDNYKHKWSCYSQHFMLWAKRALLQGSAQRKVSLSKQDAPDKTRTHSVWYNTTKSSRLHSHWDNSQHQEQITVSWENAVTVCIGYCLIKFPHIIVLPKTFLVGTVEQGQRSSSKLVYSLHYSKQRSKNWTAGPRINSTINNRTLHTQAFVIMKLSSTLEDRKF